MKDTDVTFMSDLGPVTAAHNEAQAAVMGAMLSEIQCWRALADAGHMDTPSTATSPIKTSGNKRKRSEETSDEVCTYTPASNHPASNTLPQVDRLKRLLEEERAKSKSLTSSLESATNKNAELAKTLEKREKEGRGGGDVRCEQRENAAKEREGEAARLAEKYRVKRRNLGHVLEARQEIMHLCSTNPTLKKALTGVMTKWKDDHNVGALSPDTVLFSRAPSASVCIGLL